MALALSPAAVLGKPRLSRDASALYEALVASRAGVHGLKWVFNGSAMSEERYERAIAELEAAHPELKAQLAEARALRLAAQEELRRRHDEQVEAKGLRRTPARDVLNSLRAFQRAHARASLVLRDPSEADRIAQERTRRRFPSHAAAGPSQWKSDYAVWDYYRREKNRLEQEEVPKQAAISPEMLEAWSRQELQKLHDAEEELLKRFLIEGLEQGEFQAYTGEGKSRIWGRRAVDRKSLKRLTIADIERLELSETTDYFRVRREGERETQGLILDNSRRRNFPGAVTWRNLVPWVPKSPGELSAWDPERELNRRVFLDVAELFNEIHQVERALKYPTIKDQEVRLAELERAYAPSPEPPSPAETAAEPTPREWLRDVKWWGNQQGPRYWERRERRARWKFRPFITEYSNERPYWRTARKALGVGLTAATLTAINLVARPHLPGFLPSDWVPDVVAQWLQLPVEVSGEQERSHNKVPSGAEVFRIAPHGARSLEELPTRFHFADATTDWFENLDERPGMRGFRRWRAMAPSIAPAAFTLSSMRPYVVKDGKVVLPTPQGYDLKDLRLTDSRGQELRGVPIRNDSGEYAAFVPDAGIRAVHFQVVFSEGRAPVTQPLPPELAALDQAALTEQAHLLREAGFARLADDLELALRSARENGLAFSARDLESVLSGSGRYSYYPAAVRPPKGSNPYLAYREFADGEGRLCAQCDASNDVFVDVLDAVTKHPVWVERRSSINRESGSDVLTADQRHATSRAVTDAGHFDFDATPFLRDPRAPYPDSPIEVPLGNRPKETAWHERRRIAPKSGHEEEPGNEPTRRHISNDVLRDHAAKLAALQEALLENPYLRRFRPPWGNSRIPSLLALRSSQELQEYLAGRTSFEALANQLHQIFPEVEAALEEPEDLQDFFGEAARLQREALAKAKTDVMTGRKTPYAAFANPLLSNPIESLLHHMARHPWRPLPQSPERCDVMMATLGDSGGGGR